MPGEENSPASAVLEGPGPSRQQKKNICCASQNQAYFCEMGPPLLCQYCPGTPLLLTDDLYAPFGEGTCVWNVKMYIGVTGFSFTMLYFTFFLL